MSERPPLQILEALGEELERATLADERAATERRRFRLPGLPMIALIAAVSVTSVAAAATHLFGLAAPVSAPARVDVPPEARPLPSTVAMAGINASDPDGLPSWDVRVSRSATGEICTAVGQTQGGTFGILGLDQKFRALPLGAADACGAAPGSGKIQIGAREAIGNGTMSPRTLVVGIAGPGVTQVTVDPGAPQGVRLGRDRTFLVVLKGLPEQVQPIVTYDLDHGHVQRGINLASDEADATRDPEYGQPAWEYRTGPEKKFVYLSKAGQRPGTVAPKPGRDCVAARQQEDPTTAGTDADYFPASTPITCWPSHRAPVVMTVRRLVPSLGGIGPFAYGINPARTIVQGIASSGVKSIRIPPGKDHNGVLSIGPVPHGSLDFAWVFDGKVDPAGVELDVTLKNGKELTVKSSSGSLVDPSGHTYTLPRSPAWVDVKAVKAQLGDGTFTTKLPGTDAISRAVKSPAGGPDWAAHTWVAQSNRPSDPGDHEALVCAAFGPLVDGKVRQVVGTRVTDAEPTGRAIRCTPQHPAALTGRHAPPDFQSIFPTVYVDDPASPTPRVVLVAMTSLFPGVTAATLELHRGHVMTRASVGPRGTVIALMPPSYSAPGTQLRWHLVYGGGRHVTTDWASVSPGLPKGPPAVRAADPGGAAGWALNAVSLRNPTVPAFPGQVVGGRIGGLDPATGQVAWSNGSTRAAPISRTHPVSFSVQTMLDSPANQPGIAQVQRRIAPGRTAIYGHAIAGTKTVTIQTPRDVRTVRPSAKGGLFLAVYDGRFTQGRITVTANGPGIHGSSIQPVNR